MKRSNSSKLKYIENYEPENVFVCVICQHPKELLQGLYWSYCYFVERWPAQIYVHSINSSISKQEMREFYNKNIESFWDHINRFEIQSGEDVQYIEPKLTICFSNEKVDDFYQGALKNLNENLYEVSSNEKKLLSICKNDFEFSMPMISRLQSAKAIVKGKCSSFLRLEETSHDGKSNRIDVYVDRYYIDFAYVNLMCQYGNYARDFDYLMARYARKHDNISAVEVKPATVKSKAHNSSKSNKKNLDFIHEYEFSCLDSKTIFGEMMPERLRPSEFSIDEIKGNVSHHKQVTNSQCVNHNNALKIPKIELNLYSKIGTANKPVYQLSINDKDVLLSQKNTVYLFTWLTSSKAHYITCNKQLGFEKTVRLYNLLTEQTNKISKKSDENVQSDIALEKQINEIVSYFRQSEMNKLSTIVGSKVASKLKKLPYTTTCNILNDPDLGGYLGGKTENIDKNEFRSSLIKEGVNEQQIEWLIPKSIDDINKVREYFQNKNAIDKPTVAKTALAGLLKIYGESFYLYESIVESKKHNTSNVGKSTNSKRPKLFVCALPSNNISIMK